MARAIVPRSPLLLCFLFLASCAHAPMSLVSLDGSQTSDLSRVSAVMEDQHHPVLLRGLDGVAVKSMRVPSALGEYAYVMSAGTHVLWTKSVAYPHPLIPQRIRCYILRVELVQGGWYLLKEDVKAKRAFLAIAATGEVVSTGELVDEPWVFMKDCKWD